VPLRYDGKVVGLLHIHVEPGVEIDSEEKALLEEVARDIAFARSKILADQRLRHAQQQIIEQERHRALSTMASGIAHDFNNALSTILGFTDLLLQSREKLANRDTAVRYLEMIQKAASNAAETVKRMRKFYRPFEDKVMKAVDMNDLITEALSMTRPRWEGQARAAGVEITVEKKLGEISKLQGNEAELHEMLSNLIFNAVEAMPEGGTLELKTRQEDDNVVIEFRDTGIGMHENVRMHCLEPFFTTKQGTGTGLGLSIVQGTVKRHGGSITVESTPGKGTTFRIRLPVTEHCDKSQSDTGSTTKPEPLSILVIEDAEDQRRMLAEYLAMDEHRVDTVPDGEKGLHAFMQGNYDLVITDRSMPKMRGDEVAAKIKATDPEKPIIMLTGFGDMMEATDEMVEHVDVLLSKPVKLKEFRSAILKALGKNR
jgi:signal transduction histidine kinase/CheY-like chemotaxis protein